MLKRFYFGLHVSVLVTVRPRCHNESELQATHRDDSLWLDATLAKLGHLGPIYDLWITLFEYGGIYAIFSAYLEIGHIC